MAVSGDACRSCRACCSASITSASASSKRAVVNGRQLAAIEQLRGAQRIGIFAAFEGVAQDQMTQLRQEDRRQVAGALAGQRDINRLQRRRRQQAVAEIHHEGPVFARVGIGEPRDVRIRYGAQRIGHQARMQIALGVAGIRRRHQFGPRQIGHDEFRRRDQAAVIGAAREMMARGDPEFSHVRSVVLAPVLISPRRSTSSAGSPSPSTSWKVKALAWACNRSASAAPGRGFSVRKRSRISPFSTLRCTASSVCGG